MKSTSSGRLRACTRVSLNIRITPPIDDAMTRFWRDTFSTHQLKSVPAKRLDKCRAVSNPDGQSLDATGVVYGQCYEWGDAWISELAEPKAEQGAA